MTVAILSESKLNARIISKSLGTICQKKVFHGLEALEISKFSSRIYDFSELQHSKNLDSLDFTQANIGNCVAILRPSQVFLKMACLKMGFGLVLDSGIDPLSIRAFFEGRNALKTQNLTKLSSFSSFSYGNIKIDPNSQQIFLDGKSCALSSTEFKIFGVLANSLGKPVTRATIKQNVWGPKYSIEDRSIDSYVCRLRTKVKDTEFKIKSKKNLGYVLSAIEET